MKVAVVTKFPRNPLDPCGGVEAVSVKLIAALARLKDLELHVVTTDPDCPSPGKESWNNVTVHRLPQSRAKILRFATGEGRRQMLEYLQSLQPDIVHAHDVYGLMIQGTPLKRVFTVHGFIHEDTRVSGGKFVGLRAWMWRLAETAAWADQPHLISISPYVREYVRGFTKAVIYNIDNPVGEEFFTIPRKEQAGRIFCAAGGINPRKNILGLVRAFAALKALGVKAALRISGGAADKAYYAEIQKFVSGNSLQNDITFLGRISHEQICQELSAASFFTLVSIEENSPVSIEEAMAAGVPVVTSNRCGMPYMVSDTETGALVNPESPEDMAEVMAWVLQDDRRRTAMGVRGKAVALERFHPDVVAARTRAVYYRIAGRRNTPASN